MAKKSNAGKFVLGAAVGAALGLLFAPKSGKETRRAIKEKAIVRPISEKSSLVNPSVNTIGKKTQIVVKVEAKIAPETCLAPITAALNLFIP